MTDYDKVKKNQILSVLSLFEIDNQMLYISAKKFDLNT